MIVLTTRKVYGCIPIITIPHTSYSYLLLLIHICFHSKKSWHNCRSTNDTCNHHYSSFFLSISTRCHSTIILLIYWNSISNQLFDDLLIATPTGSISHIYSLWLPMQGSITVTIGTEDINAWVDKILSNIICMIIYRNDQSCGSIHIIQTRLWKEFWCAINVNSSIECFCDICKVTRVNIRNCSYLRRAAKRNLVSGRSVAVGAGRTRITIFSVPSRRRGCSELKISANDTTFPNL